MAVKSCLNTSPILAYNCGDNHWKIKLFQRGFSGSSEGTGKVTLDMYIGRHS